MGVRITITVREPVKKEIAKIARRQDRPLSEVSSNLLEEALKFRQSESNDAAVYLRDVDGTGSMHPCSKGDRGAVLFVPA